MDDSGGGDRASAPAGGEAGPPQTVNKERRGDRTAHAAIDWLDARTAATIARGSSGFTSTTRTIPTIRRRRLREAFAGRLYDGEIAFADEAIGSVLDAVAAPRPARASARRRRRRSRRESRRARAKRRTGCSSTSATVRVRR